jgi:hypothetical protein
MLFANCEGKRMKQNEEFEKFDVTMHRLIKVPHSTIKAKLDAEKSEKKRKPKKASVSGRASSGKD